MILIRNREVVGWEHAIRGMRNPMNSWEKSDSEKCHPLENCFHDCNKVSCEVKEHFHIGPNDHKLIMQLRNAGTDHRKFMRMITVYCDILAPLYWWKEFDTYKVGTVVNSCSTMHRIHSKKFTIEDFSCEHLETLLGKEWDESLLIDVPSNIGGGQSYSYAPAGVLGIIIQALNKYREGYLKTKDKKYWWQMIQLLPSSYNQLRTVMMNYEVLANIYKSRKDHKLYEWINFCVWIESLPYSEFITGRKNND